MNIFALFFLFGGILAFMLGVVAYEKVLKNTLKDEVLQNTITNFSEATIIVSPDEKILSANQAILKLINFEEDELVGCSLSDIITKEFRSYTKDELIFTEPLNTDNIETIETQFLTKQGKVIPVLLSPSVMQDDRGAIENTVLVIRDITEQKESEEKIKNHSENLEKTIEDAKKKMLVELKDSEARYSGLYESSIERV